MAFILLIRCGQRWERAKARFNRTYRVFTRSIEPKPSSAEPRVPIEDLLITNRGLCVCMLSGKECPVVDPTPILVAPDLDVSLAAGIVDEPGVSIQPELLSRRGTDNSSEPAVKQLLSEIQRAMVTSSQSPRRRPFDDKLEILDTEYFRKEIKKILPTEWLEAALASVSELTQTVVDTLGADCTVGQGARHGPSNIRTANRARFSRRHRGAADDSWHDNEVLRAQIIE